MKPNYSDLSFSKLLSKINYFDLPNKVKEVLSRLQPKYKVYTAILTQEGTSAPTAEVLDNTIGNIVWSREEAGSYIGTLSSAFKDKKTVCFVTEIGGIVTPSIISGRTTDNTVNINVNSLDGEQAEDLTGILSIEIRVYN